MFMVYMLLLHCYIFLLSCKYWADGSCVWSLVNPVTLTVRWDSCADYQRSFLELFSVFYLWVFFFLHFDFQDTSKEMRSAAVCLLSTCSC